MRSAVLVRPKREYKPCWPLPSYEQLQHSIELPLAALTSSYDRSGGRRRNMMNHTQFPIGIGMSVSFRSEDEDVTVGNRINDGPGVEMLTSHAH